MPKRSGKKDLNEKAFSIVQQLTGQAAEEKSEKNPAAVALGRLGGLEFRRDNFLAELNGKLLSPHGRRVRDGDPCAGSASLSVSRRLLGQSVSDYLP